MSRMSFEDFITSLKTKTRHDFEEYVMHSRSPMDRRRNHIEEYLMSPDRRKHDIVDFIMSPDRRENNLFLMRKRDALSAQRRNEIPRLFIVEKIFEISWEKNTGIRDEEYTLAIGAYPEPKMYVNKTFLTDCKRIIDKVNTPDSKVMCNVKITRNIHEERTEVYSSHYVIDNKYLEPRQKRKVRCDCALQFAFEEMTRRFEKLNPEAAQYFARAISMLFTWDNHDSTHKYYKERRKKIEFTISL